MSDRGAEAAYDFSQQAAPKPSTVRQRAMLLAPFLLLGCLLWVSNWFFQRARLFQDTYAKMGDPSLPWGKLIGEDAARRLFGMPVELYAYEQRFTPYQYWLLGGYSSLQKLQLCGTTDSDMRRLSRLTKLESLVLMDSSVTDDALQTIGTFNRLRQLEIRSSGRVASQITNEGLKSLAGLRDLRMLSLHAPEISGDGLAPIARLPSLDELSLYEADIRGDGLSPLAQIPRLSLLRLENCRLEGDCLADCPHVWQLSLKGSNATDEVIARIPIQSVGQLFLTDTHVSRAGCEALLDEQRARQVWDAEDRRVQR